MSALDDLATVIRLACETESRTKAEQRALLRLAKRVDADWNEQSRFSPKVKSAWEAAGRPMTWSPTKPWAHLPGVLCEYSTEHSKECRCHGDGVVNVPEGGWSELESLARETVGEVV